MADNYTTNAGTGGNNYASDDIAGVQHPRVKIQIGADGSAADVSTADPLPVSDAGGSLTVDGTVTANLAAGTNNIGDVDVLSVPAPLSTTGAGTEAAALRVTVANNSTGVLSVDDNGGSLTVDGTVAATQSGTWTVQPGNTANTTAWKVDGSAVTQPVSGTVTANPASGTITTVSAVTAITNALPAGTNNIGDVDVLTLPALPAGNNNIGDVDIVSGTITTVSTVTALTGGGVAHDGADSGNPVKVGGRAVTADITAVAASDRTDQLTDALGYQLVRPYALHENLVQGATAAITGTASTEVIAAGGAGVRNYITSLTVINSHATVSTVVELRDGASTVIHRGYALAAGGGYTITFPTPLRGSTATAVNAFNITTASNVYVSASGYRAAV